MNEKQKQKKIKKLEKEIEKLENGYKGYYQRLRKSLLTTPRYAYTLVETEPEATVGAILKKEHFPHGVTIDINGNEEVGWCNVKAVKNGYLLTVHFED